MLYRYCFLISSSFTSDRFFFPKTENDVENPKINGSRTDNRSLVNEFWKGHFIWNRIAMHRIQLGDPTPIFRPIRI